MAHHPYRYVSVMGTMGSGKTTAARLIAQKLGYKLIEENFGENAFLPRFYRRMKRWAFHSQTFFLMEKITQLMEIPSERQHHCIVQDTPIVQDVFSYAKAQYISGNMDDAEWKLYQKIYTSLEPHIPKPDLIVYLETSLPEVSKRILSRGRGYEKKIPKKYIRLLDTLNHEWIGKNEHSHRIVTMQTDHMNIVTSKSAQDVFLTRLAEELRQIKSSVDN